MKRIDKILIAVIIISVLMCITGAILWGFEEELEPFNVIPFSLAMIIIGGIAGCSAAFTLPFIDR